MCLGRTNITQDKKKQVHKYNANQRDQLIQNMCMCTLWQQANFDNG